MIYAKLVRPFEFIRVASDDYHFRTFPAGTLIQVEGALDEHNFYTVHVTADRAWGNGRVERTHAKLCSALEALVEAAE